MDEAEKAIFNVSERRLKHDVQPIRAVLSDYYDRIDDLAKRPEEILRRADRLHRPRQNADGLAALRPADHRRSPGQGKTGFLLSVAKNAALTHKKHVAIFSLEMSNEQVVQRLIAQETGIDSQRLRIGQTDTKMNGRSSPMPSKSSRDTHIYLDDTPAITPLQIAHQMPPPAHGIWHRPDHRRLSAVDGRRHAQR